MSEHTLAVVRRATTAGNAGDLRAVLDLVHPDIEWRDRMHAPDVPEVLHGIAELQKLAARWEEAYEGLTAEVLEYIDEDPWVLCVTRWHAEGKGSGMPVDVRSHDAYEVVDGLITRSYGGYEDLASLRRAIGLAE